MMLQRATVYKPTRITVYLEDGPCYLVAGDGTYGGVTISFEDEAGLRRFVLGLVRGLDEPGVQHRIAGGEA